MTSVTTERDERDVVHIAMNRPETRNAFSSELVDELIAAIVAASEDPTVRAVVLSGAGPVFCSGGDIDVMRAMAAFTLEENLADSAKLNSLFRVLDECRCPVLVRVHKAARGGGVGLVACADVAIATTGTTFAFSEVRLGIIPAVISTYVRPKIGWSWARRLLITGETFDAALAVKIGLVHEVVDANQIDARIEAVLDEILAARPGAQRWIKAVLIPSMTAETDRDTLAQRAITEASAARMSAEGRAGLTAFLESHERGRQS